MAGLLTNNRISVQTKHGDCSIELCLGSITQLQDPVDVLVLSAFPGDYSATPTSVIGALRRDLQINVRELAKNKEEDLRKLFSCWWSKLLPDRLPFKRILCFEGGFKKNARPPSTVGEVFRSLISLCRNEDLKVIMPLLAAGDQGYSKQLMLRLIVEATIHWMQVGLPLKVLKIVVYTRHSDTPDDNVLQLTRYFEELKKKWRNVWTSGDVTLTDSNFQYDIYLSYSPCDSRVADMVYQALIKDHNKLRIFSKRQEINLEQSWQEEIYQLMLVCAKVVALLSPKYLEDTSCIEQYNIALCCSRQTNRDYLAPLYVEEIAQMPTYMGLIQYVDCRPISVEMIRAACANVSACIRTEKKESKKEKNLLNKKMISLDDSYDVFISYSHRDTTIANKAYNYIRKIKPDWNIFIDQSGLRTGSAWQSKLYKSIENSKAVLSLLSSNYMNSKVCQEEYNLARALHEDPNYTTRLIEVNLECVDVWPLWCTPNFIIDFSDEKLTRSKVQQVVSIIDIENRYDHTLQPSNAVLSIKHISSIWRQEFAKQKFPITKGVDILDEKSLQSLQYISKTKFDVVLSYHRDDSVAANNLIVNLCKHIPSIKISSPSPANEKSVRLHVIDEGKMVVPLLSEKYVKSPELMEEFNTALCRHRYADELVMFPIVVGQLPISPVYPQIALCLFSVLDKYWLTQLDGDPIVSCLSFSAIVIANLLVNSARVKSSFKTLVSMRELEDWSFFKARNGEETTSDLTPILFSATNSGHAIAEPEIAQHGSEASNKDCAKMVTIDKNVSIINDDVKNSENNNNLENRVTNASEYKVAVDSVDATENLEPVAQNTAGKKQDNGLDEVASSTGHEINDELEPETTDYQNKRKKKSIMCSVT